MSSFRLDANLVKRAQEFATDLRDATTELREAWDEKSERWQDGDAGQSADAWIESLENLTDELDAIDPEPEV